MTAAAEEQEKGTLREQLEELIRDQLIFLQQQDERDRMREILIEMWDPQSPTAFEQIALVFKRMARVQTILRRAGRSQMLFPWAALQATAATFEGIYEQCTLWWLAAPAPKDPDKLDPSVEQLISFQVRWFTAALGA